MPSRPARGVASPADDKKQLQRAVEIGKDLIARYPTSPEYRALLARCYVRVAAVSRSAAALAKAEDEASKASSAAALAEAEDDLSRAVDLEKKLAVEFASVASYRVSLVWSLHQLAGVQIARHRWPQARASLEEEIADWKKIQESSPQIWQCSRHARRLIRLAGQGATGRWAKAHWRMPPPRRPKRRAFIGAPPPTAIFTAIGSGRRHRNSPALAFCPACTAVTITGSHRERWPSGLRHQS